MIYNAMTCALAHADQPCETKICCAQNILYDMRPDDPACTLEPGEPVHTKEAVS